MVSYIRLGENKIEAADDQLKNAAGRAYKEVAIKNVARRIYMEVAIKILPGGHIWKCFAAMSNLVCFVR